jgi:hypothetical protein
VKVARKLKGQRYIQPCNDGIFPAGVYSQGRPLPEHKIFDEFDCEVRLDDEKVAAKFDCEVRLDDDELITMSEVLDFKSEYRTFISGREVAAVCCTKFMGEPTTKHSRNANSKVITIFVNSLLKDESIECAPGTVIDVGMVGSGKMAIKQCLPAWKADLFGADPAAALSVLADSCEVAN